MRQGVMAAITAAVNAYIEQEEEPRRAVLAAKPALAVSPWRFFGRQEQMRLRISIQQRVRR